MKLGRVYVSPGFLLLAAALFYVDPQGLGLEIILAWGCHETAHIAALYAVGGRVGSCRLTVEGANIRTEQGKGLSYVGELLAVLAGPGCNLLLANFFARCGAGWYPAAGVQLVLGVFNLLPLPGLDGSRVFRLLGALLLEETKKRKFL